MSSTLPDIVYHWRLVAIAKLTRKGKTHLQVGALPLRRGADQETMVLLITSRTTRRWTIPKGWPMKGLKDHKAAGREALEEAGVVGPIGKAPIGTYQYWKRNAATFHLCEVSVYTLKVDRQVHKWRERGQRAAEWFSVAEAATLVQEPGLKAIIERLGPFEPTET